jgi:hypothetical protein
MLMGKNMEREHSPGLIKRHTLVNSEIIIFMDWEHINGQMGENLQENGEITKCMVREYLNGLTGGDMKEATLMIRRKATVSLNGKYKNNIFIKMHL